MHARSNPKTLLKMAEVSSVLHENQLLWYAELEVTKAMTSQYIHIIEHH
jgi:hypothetical protein